MPNWTPDTLKLLGTVSDAQLAKRFGCSPAVINKKRRKLGIPAFGCAPNKHAWGSTDLGLLGFPDAEVARITGHTVTEVAAKRKELGR